MKVTHLQSSTQIITLGDIKVLTDPWLTDGEYYGSWYHYPPFGERNIDALDYDFIYVSHIHPDHLSEQTFKRLPIKKPVLIHNYASKFVKRKLEALGYDVIECDNGEPFVFGNGGSITIYAADNCNPEICGKFLGCGVVEKKFGSTQIDTLALFEMDGEIILNTNDCPFELASETIKANRLHEKNIDLLLVGYAGAGPYPQCFDFDTIEEKMTAAKAKEQQFLDQAMKYIRLLKPSAYAPFAGTYILGSKLSELSAYRGVPSVADAVSSLNDKLSNISKAVLLEKLDVYDVSEGSLIKSTDTYELSHDEYLDLISSNSLIYDEDQWDDAELDDLIRNAYDRFLQKAEEIRFRSDAKLVVQSDKVAFQFGTNTELERVSVDGQIKEPFVKITVDHNLLHRLLRGPRYAHWNNAEIGSHLKFLRKPNQFERGLYHCLCFLHQ
jgi:UDP-MurNAc hydroxylase